MKVKLALARRLRQETIMKLKFFYLMRRHFAAAAVGIALAAAPAGPAQAQAAEQSGAAAHRERLLMDIGWHFALGHATDPAKDFDPSPASNNFNYFAKAGNGLGAAAMDFDDQTWRTGEPAARLGGGTAV